MNEHDLLDAIGTAEESMLEASEKRPLLLRKPLLTAAACLLLVISTVLSIVSIAGNTAPLPGQTISKEKLTWLRSSNILSAPYESSGSVPSYYAYEYQFTFQMSVEARVLDVLPGKYQSAGNHTHSQKYKILRMELLDPIFAPDMPSQFYYLLPEELSADLKRFDSLIMVVEQMCCENVLMQNVNRSRLESFSFLFWSGLHEPNRGAVIACKDGKVDLSLWQMEGWCDWEGWPESLADPQRRVLYPGKRDRSITQVKEAIQQGLDIWRFNQNNRHSSVLSNSILNWPEAQAILEQVKPFENGYYNSYTSGKGDDLEIGWRRYINGFPTNEIITIYLSTKEIKIYNAFSDEEIANLPDLSPHILFARWRTAPKPRNSKREPYKFCGARGRYEKHGEHIFGIITINWGYPDTKESPRASDCIIRKIRTHSYLLVYPNGKTAEAMDRDTLDALIANYTG